MKKISHVLIFLSLIISQTLAQLSESVKSPYLIDTTLQKQYIQDPFSLSSAVNTTFKYIVFDASDFKTLYLNNVYFKHCLFDNVSGLNNIHLASKYIYFIGSSLSNLNLVQANFKSVSHIGTDFSYSNLKNSNFNNATLDHVIVEGANLNNTTFFNATIEDTDFEQAHVDNAFFIFSNLEDNTQLSQKGAITSFSDWKKAIQNKTAFKNIVFEDIEIQNENLNYLIVQESQFKNVMFKKVHLKLSQMKDVTFFNVKKDVVSYYSSTIENSLFEFCSIKQSDITSAKITQSEFRHCVFENVNFSKSTFDTVTFKHCTFKNCDFSAVKWKKIRIKKSSGLPKKQIKPFLVKG